MKRRTQILKRAIDVVGATAGLVLTAPLFPIVAVAVRATSRGPVLYRQRRCGAERRSGVAPRRPPISERRRARGFHTFEMYKFRTMHVDAEVSSGAVLAKKDDPRLTVIGGFLRRTRLDELPQLVHVLRGEMSLVGPRPERPELMAKLEATVPFFEERMRLIKPGITGLAQVMLGYDGAPIAASRARPALARPVDALPPGPASKDPELRGFAN
ncbi:sugar transferase, partial [Myxococcota bacterium]|nr:sugar transferase [Myxococcota bacterium]